MWTLLFLMTTYTNVEFVRGSHLEQQNFTVCQNDNCKRAASRILSAMNTSADPCENFYDYACGNWKIMFDTTTKFRRLLHDTLLGHRIKRKLKDILEEPLNRYDDDLLIKLKSIYRLCMDLEKRDKVGVRPISNLLNNIGGWPIAMEDGAWQTRTWQEIDNYYLRLDGTAAFFRFTVRPDPDNVNHKILTLHPRDIIPFNANVKKYPSGKDPRNPYPEIIASIAQIIAESNGVEISREKIMRDAMDIYDFQKNLVDVLSEKDLEENGWEIMIMNLTYAQSTYNECLNDTFLNNNNSRHCPGHYANPKAQINFLHVFKNYLSGMGIEISESTNVKFFNFASLCKLAKLLSATPLKVIVNYVHYGFVVRKMKYSSRQMLNLYVNGMSYNDVVRYKEWPQWKRCISDIKMQSALTYYYLQRHYLVDNIPLVNEVIEAIQDKTLKRIHKATWMNDNTKELATQKLFNMKKFIGYSKNARNLTYQSELYGNVSLQANYIETMLNLKRAGLRNYLWTLTQPYDSDKWLADATAVNAFYLLSGNAIYIPVGIMQDPYFLPDLPIAVIYGSLGFIAAHEISHGFVPEALLFFSGRLYHVNGERDSWWSEEQQKVYDDRVNCFVEQFDKYSVVIPTDPPKTVQLNGRHVLAENIADTCGVITAFEAFRAKLEERNESSLKLPGLVDYTDEQLFFLSMANIWCTVQRPYDTEESIRRDKHSPVAARVIGTLSNSEEFSKAFKCPVGSAMNPQKKCSIW